MKKVSKIIVCLFLIGLAVSYCQPGSFLELAYNQPATHRFILEDTDSFNPGPATGSLFPGLQAERNKRRITLLTDFSGASGTVLVALRSLSNSAICREQLRQLEKLLPEFHAANIGLVVISADKPAVLDKFARENNITIPLLSDIAALSFTTLGILDHSYTENDAEYGSPYPGAIVLSGEQKVVGKLFLGEQDTRIHASATLSFAQQMLEQ